MKFIAFFLSFSGTALFIVGVAGLFVANAPVNKKHPQRLAEIERATEIIGASGAVMIAAGFPILMSSGKKQKQ